MHAATVQAQLRDALRAPSPLLQPAYTLDALDRELFVALHRRALLQGCVVAVGTEAGTIFTWTRVGCDVVVLRGHIYMAPLLDIDATQQWTVFTECDEACLAIAQRLQE